jgi:hypothetical protein
MASDVEDLTTFYADLPSIFENNSSSYNATVTDVNIEKSYQPMFGSFLFADSDPLSRAAFVASSSPSIEIDTRQEQLMEDSPSSDENNISSNIETTLSSPLALVPVDDIDEDDFDGIPIRHAPLIIKKKLNGDNDLISNHSKHEDLLNEFIHHIEDSHNDNDLEDDSFLNGFTDEQHDTTAIVPSLFKNIPDIDDLNEHEDDDDNDKIPFDHMDMFDQSDSIRSSSPDSLLSSSNLQDDDIDIDNEVVQWNDDLILNTTTTSSNINSHPSLNLHINPFNQVDFIDTSRSNSRCSNVSSHLSVGYTDQAHTFLSDDGLLTSSDSDDNDHIINFHSNTFNYSENEDIRLQVNLDDHRSISSFSKSNSTRSSSPIPDETPITDIDEDNNLQIAPIAALDDEDEDDDNLQTFISDQPVLPYIRSHIQNLLDLKNERRQNEIVHDIINMRHLFNDHDHDDEFIAVMHNPKIFEQVLYNDDQKVIYRNSFLFLKYNMSRLLLPKNCAIVSRIEAVIIIHILVN